MLTRDTHRWPGAVSHAPQTTSPPAASEAGGGQCPFLLMYKNIGRFCSWGPGRPLLWGLRMEACRQREGGVPERGLVGTLGAEVMLSPTGPGSH